MTRLSCHRFRSNQVRLALSLLAYNLGNLWRRLGLPRGIENWSLTSLQQRLVKTGGRLVKHARYYWLLLAEGHLSRRRFGAMLGRIALFPVPTGWRAIGSSQQRNPGTTGWGKERCCKSGGISGNFRPCRCGSQTVGGGPYENCFTLAANSRMGV